MIDMFIKEVSEILQIPAPEISFDTSMFPTETTLAQCEIDVNDPDGCIIHLRKCDKPNPDQLFAIAHELRHIWQFRQGLYLPEYKERNECESVEEYNLQLAEIDANAFGAIIMNDFFGMKPLFQGLSETVKEEIAKQIKHIVATTKKE